MSAECGRWAELTDLEAIGESLDAADRAFVLAHAARCAACGREAAVYEELGALVRGDAPRVAPPPAEPQAPAPRVARPAGRRPAAWVALGIAAAAVAAAAAFVAPMLHSTPTAVAVAPAARPAIDAGASAGLVPGSELATGDGTTCVTLDPTIRVCLAPNTRVRVASLAAHDRVLSLEVGKLTAELAPQPPGASFSVGTRDGMVTAIGTAFSVEVLAERPTIARVMHGVVRVRPASGPARDLAAHMELELGGESPKALSTTDEAREMAVLSLAPKAPEAPPPVAVAAPAPSPPSSAVAVAPSPSDLLISARDQRARGDARGAASTYGELSRRYPDTVEAHASLVPLGELELGPLGDAEAALRAFDRYLAKGGTLAQEASDGRVRALRALGRTEQELAAIRAFLAAYPESPHASAMNERLRALSVAP